MTRFLLIAPLLLSACAATGVRPAPPGCSAAHRPANVRLPSLGPPERLRQTEAARGNQAVAAGRPLGQLGSLPLPRPLQRRPLRGPDSHHLRLFDRNRETDWGVAVPARPPKGCGEPVHRRTRLHRPPLRLRPRFSRGAPVHLQRRL